jgi:hypothetical protein
MMGVHHAGHDDVAGEVEHTIGGEGTELRGGADLVDHVVADQERTIPDLPPRIIEGGEIFNVLHEQGRHGEFSSFRELLARLKGRRRNSIDVRLWRPQRSGATIATAQNSRGTDTALSLMP